MVIEAFRGVGKSWLTVAFVLHQLYLNPQLKIMVVSANAVKANEFSTFTIQLIRDMPLLKHLMPGKDQRFSMISFDVGPSMPDQSPSVKSVGITGQLTGSRADIIVADDIEVVHNSDTSGKRERLLELIKEFDAVIKPGGRIIFLGTPQSEASIYNTLPDRGYTIRVWPARYPKDPEEDHAKRLSPTQYAERKYAGRLAPMIFAKLSQDESLAGQPTEPLRFDDEDLRERAMSYGRAGFALQFMLDTALSDADRYPLKIDDLIVHPCDPYRAPIDFMWASSPDLAYKDLECTGLTGDRYYRPAWYSPDVAPYEASVMFVDPSGRGKDETAYAAVKLLKGRVFLVASGGHLGGYDDATLRDIVETARKHDIKQIIVEPNYGGGMFTKLLQSEAQKMAYRCGIEDAEWSMVQKEQRIVDVLEPVLNRHRLVVCPSVIEKDYNSILKRDGERAPLYRLFYQMSHMVKAKGALGQDDRIDALAGAVAHFMDALALNTDRAVEEFKEEKLDEELERFMKGILFDKSGDKARKINGGRIL